MADPKIDVSNEWMRPQRGRVEKFRDAMWGVVWGARGQSSFVVHALAATGVVATAALSKLDVERWCLLIICIGVVLAAEMFNSALETICRAITTKFDKHVQRGLDIASGAVLIVAITAAFVGVLIFVDAYLKIDGGAG